MVLELNDGSYCTDTVRVVVGISKTGRRVRGHGPRARATPPNNTATRATSHGGERVPCPANWFGGPFSRSATSCRPTRSPTLLRAHYTVIGNNARPGREHVRNAARAPSSVRRRKAESRYSRAETASGVLAASITANELADSRRRQR